MNETVATRRHRVRRDLSYQAPTSIVWVVRNFFFYDDSDSIANINYASPTTTVLLHRFGRHTVKTG
jgi:hypothetical protein